VTPTDEQREAARAWIHSVLIAVPLSARPSETSLATLLAERERAAHEAGRQSVFDASKLLPSPASGNAGQGCQHSNTEIFTGGWRCRACGYSWAWRVTT
jgi:hypothetical protein